MEEAMQKGPVDDYRKGTCPVYSLKFGCLTGRGGQMRLGQVM